MKNFIEVTNRENEKCLLNINCIFKVAPVSHDLKLKCRISLTPNGSNQFPYQYVETQETYEEIKELIKSSI